MKGADLSMTTLQEVDEPATRRGQAATEASAETSRAAERLRTTTAAMRLSFTWFGTRKTLSPQQKARAAESFGAEGDYLSAGKKLFDVRHPKFRAVTQVRGRCVQFWKSMSLPFPEPGVRLIKRDDIGEVDARMTRFKSDLEEAVAELDRHYGELKAAARERLGDLYSASDYPASLLGLFDVAWEYPSVEPPPYLQRLAPDLYRQECERAQARFDEAVRLAEQAFLEELSQLVSHLAERLSGGSSDGKPKVFRDSAVTNMVEFFETFRRLNVRSNEQLDALVEEAQRIVRGVRPQQLRENTDLRQHVAEQLGEVQSVLDDLLVDRPRRAIIRKPR
jgi:hypothetical protein